MPAEEPVTIPVLPTVATEGLEDDHVPPMAGSDRVVVFPVHTTYDPVIVPGSGTAITVSVIVVKHPVDNV